ncbi:MAG: DUF6152 family protein [Steroidobacteraceae bacterium]
MLKATPLRPNTVWSVLVSVLLATFIVPHQSSAHHSIAAFDASRTTELTGTLTSAQIANPHSVFHIAARDAEGRVTHWTIEGAGAATVLREVRGGPPDRFAAGQAVTVKFLPARDGGNTGNLVSMRFADGQVLNGIRVP